MQPSSVVRSTRNVVRNGRFEWSFIQYYAGFLSGGQGLRELNWLAVGYPVHWRLVRQSSERFTEKNTQSVSRKARWWR